MMVGPDNTPRILDEIRAKVGPEEMHILHLSKSVGKKGQLKQQVKSLKEKFMLLWIAIVIWQVMLLKKLRKIFMSDTLIGALTAQGKVRGAHTGNILLKMQQVYIDG